MLLLDGNRSEICAQSGGSGGGGGGEVYNIVKKWDTRDPCVKVFNFVH